MNNFASKEFWSIVIGGSVLSLNAGFINVVTLAGVFNVTVSHVTGNVTRMAITILNQDLGGFALIASILSSFMFGSFTAGFMVGDAKYRLGKTYGYALLLESAALFLSFYFLKRELVLGEWCAAFACGLQNALATSYSGAVVRTTHMTGICTDIGNILGQACRTDTSAELWRLKVHVPLLVSYWMGGILGQLAYKGVHENALLFPCFFTGALSLIYLFLPIIQEAKSVLVETTRKLQLDGKPPSSLEIRQVGDPRLADKYMNVSNMRDIDAEIKTFLYDLQDSENVLQHAPQVVASFKPTSSKSNRIDDVEMNTFLSEEEGLS